MRGIIAGLMVLGAVAGCGGGEPAAGAVAPAVAHERMVAGLAGAYIWDCTLESDAGGASWRFALQRRGEGNRAEVVVLEAGLSVTRRVEVRRDNAARVYTMRDGSRVLVATDGEVQARGKGVARASDHPTGRCRKGGQPA